MRRLGLAASGVAEHLSVLRLAGLIESQRRGRFVHYRLNQTGVGLLELLASHQRLLEAASS